MKLYHCCTAGFIYTVPISAAATRAKKLGVIRVFSENPWMDWTRIHLALNHLPVIGIPLLVLMLLIGTWRKSNELTRFALWSLMIIAAVAIAIKFTGDFAAEQSVARLAGAKDFVSHHEETGDQVTTAVFVLGLSAALALFLARNRRPVRRWALMMVLLLGLIAGLLYARTAHSGGQISHPELRSVR